MRPRPSPAPLRPHTSPRWTRAHTWPPQVAHRPLRNVSVEPSPAGPQALVPLDTAARLARRRARRRRGAPLGPRGPARATGALPFGFSLPCVSTHACLLAGRCRTPPLAWHGRATASCLSFALPWDPRALASSDSGTGFRFWRAFRKPRRCAGWCRSPGTSFMFHTAVSTPSSTSRHAPSLLSPRPPWLGRAKHDTLP